MAAAYDGHPENAAASVYGGLVAATTVEGVPVYARLPLSDELAFDRHRPDRNLSTPGARAVLPETLSRADVVFNLGRMGLLLAGLADPTELTPEATDDRIHQLPRTTLFPEAPGLLQGLVDAGALAASWSGAGPALIGMVRAGARDAVQSRGREGAGRVGRPRSRPGAAGRPARHRLRRRGRSGALRRTVSRAGRRAS